MYSYADIDYYEQLKVNANVFILIYYRCYIPKYEYSTYFQLFFCNNNTVT